MWVLGRQGFQQSLLWFFKFQGFEDLLFEDQPLGGDRFADSAQAWTCSPGAGFEKAPSCL